MRARAANRPGSWWLGTLQKRARNAHSDGLDLSGPAPFTEPLQKQAAIKFFNAAYLDEQSG
jgi:hypothetical protein